MNRTCTPEVLDRLGSDAARFRDEFNRPRRSQSSGVSLPGLILDGEPKRIDPLSREVTLPPGLQVAEPDQALLRLLTTGRSLPRPEYDLLNNLLPPSWGHERIPGSSSETLMRRSDRANIRNRNRRARSSASGIGNPDVIPDLSPLPPRLSRTRRRRTRHGPSSRPDRHEASSSARLYAFEVRPREGRPASALS